MTYHLANISANPATLPELPAWVTSSGADSIEAVAFRSGAALAALDGLVTDPAHGVPVKLLANQLALTSAANMSKLEGRFAQEADIRDAYYLTPAGDARGPDGELLSFWRKVARLPLTGGDWQQELGDLTGHSLEARVEDWVDAGCAHARSHGPMAACVSVMRRALSANDRAERIACVLSDVVLAHALSWQKVLPLTAMRLTKPGLRKLITDGQGAELEIQRRILNAIEDTVRLARNLAGRAAALRAVAPKLRARGSEAAVALFLSETAVAPSSMLAPKIYGTTIPMTDRAARRLCGRLVELGVARELTGRPTFRLYGIVS